MWEKLERVLIASPVEAAQGLVMDRLWEYCVSPYVNEFRRQIKMAVELPEDLVEEMLPEHLRAALTAFLGEIDEALASLLAQYCGAHRVQFDVFKGLAWIGAPPTDEVKSAVQATLARLCVCTGDIGGGRIRLALSVTHPTERYKQEGASTKDMSLAQRHYSAANSLDPTLGTVSNRLCVVYMERPDQRLRAALFAVRATTCRRPFAQAGATPVTVFEKSRVEALKWLRSSPGNRRLDRAAACESLFLGLQGMMWTYTEYGEAMHMATDPSAWSAFLC